jgi:hypothetical protein
VSRRDFTVVDDHFFHQGVADARHACALDLSLVHQRIEHGAGVVRRSELLKLDLSGFRVDFHFRHLDAHRSCVNLGIIVKSRIDGDRCSLGFDNFTVGQAPFHARM